MKIYNTYTLKVNLKYDKNVYRIIRIDGNSSLHELSVAILNSFNFDDEHAYMFSMKRKKYDEDGYYHPDSGFGKNAGKTKLDKIGLKVRNKFLYLYDFGDEWMFEISVSKVDQGNIRTLTLITESCGEIEQYPTYEYTKESDIDMSSLDYIYDEDDDFYEDDEYEEEFEKTILFRDSDKSMIQLLCHQTTTIQKKIMKNLGIEIPNRKKGLAIAYSTEIVKELKKNNEKLLDILTPTAVKTLLKAYQGDMDYFKLMNGSCIDSIDILKYCGLLDVEYDYDYNSITILLPAEAKEFAEFLSSSHIPEDVEERFEWYNYISAMMIVYGVIELKHLHELLCYYIDKEIDLNILIRKVLKQKEIWNEIHLYSCEACDDNIISIFDVDNTNYIMQNRQKYNIKDYKKLYLDEISLLLSGGLNIFVPDLIDLSSYLLMEKFMDETEFAMMTTELSMACMLGIEKEKIFNYCKAVLNENKINFTKKIKKIITDIIEDHPCSLLKGYSFYEYSKLENGQLSMFGETDDLPF